MAMATASSSYQNNGTCYICHTSIPLVELAEHEKQCLLDLQDGDAEYGVSGPLSDTASDDSRNSTDVSVKSLSRCYICGTTLKAHQMVSHERTCLRKWQADPSPGSKASADSVWTNLVARGELRKAKSMTSLLTTSTLKSPSNNGGASKSPFADFTPKKEARASNRTNINSIQTAVPNGRSNSAAKVPQRKKSDSNGLQRQLKAKSYGDLHRLVKSTTPVKSPIPRVTPQKRVKAPTNASKTPTPTAGRNARMIRCGVCEREFSIHSVDIHEARCLKIHNDREKLEQAEKEKEKKEKKRQPKRATSRDDLSTTPNRGAGLLRCYICGNLFGTRSLGIHEPQCLKKFHLENEKLPKNKRRSLPEKPGIPSMLLLDSGKEILYAEEERSPATATNGGPHSSPCKQLSFDDTDGVDVRSPLLKCDYCGQQFKRSSMASHVPMCREKHKRQHKNSDENRGSLFSFGLSDKGSEGSLRACRFCGKDCLVSDIDRHENRCSDR